MTATRFAGPPPAPSIRPRRTLSEIQALRAAAVLGVVIFHFWPSLLPGGFVGVDVFFVISGFLITGLIVRSLEGQSFTFREFYIRRARRLLPAAILVLGVTTVAVLTLPVTIWVDTLQQVMASLFYVENWVLALTQSDYFGGDATAVQHYWSLSVEEQYYLLWPAAVVGLWWWERKRGRGARLRTRMLLGFAVISAISLVLSVSLSISNPTLAYYATYTRIWEFGVGAALALLPRWESRPALRAATTWVGLAALLIAMVVISPSSAFPGWVALLPVLATAAVIFAGASGRRWAPDRLLQLPPVQWLGDISYSLYLWHWPPLILISAVMGQRLTWELRVALLVVVLALAWVTKVHVEDRFRVRSSESQPSAVAQDDPAPHPGTWATGAAAIGVPMALVAAVASGALIVVDFRASRADALEQAALVQGSDCFGAAALQDPSCDVPFGDSVIPDPAVAFRQFRYSKERDCMVGSTTDKVVVCEFGDPDATIHVALLGDSHALSWLPALQGAVDARGWRLSTYLRASCPANPAVLDWFDERQKEFCARWASSVIDRVVADDSIDLVVTTASRTYSWEPTDSRTSFETGVAGYTSAWSEMVAAGKSVLAIKDTPRLDDDVLACISRGSPVDCGSPRDVAIEAGLPAGSAGSPLSAAVDVVGREDVALADPVDVICGPERCEAVVGNVVVFVDGSHLSQTYARTLEPFVAGQIDRMLSP